MISQYFQEEIQISFPGIQFRDYLILFSVFITKFLLPLTSARFACILSCVYSLKLKPMIFKTSPALSHLRGFGNVSWRFSNGQTFYPPVKLRPSFEILPKIIIFFMKPVLILSVDAHLCKAYLFTSLYIATAINKF